LRSICSPRLLAVQGCKYYAHHPSCMHDLCALSGIHSPAQPWGKLDSRGSSAQVSKQDIALVCLLEGCGGRIRQTVLEKDKGTKGNLEVWYHAKWHQHELAAEERRKQEEAEARERECEAREAAAEEERKRKEAAAAAAASIAATANVDTKLSKNKRKVRSPVVMRGISCCEHGHDMLSEFDQPEFQCFVA
jgi:hypothetical protein